MSNGTIEERVRRIAEHVAMDHGLELVHVEVLGMRRRIVRIYIDKPGGVSHQDCAVVSEHVGVVLEVEDFIPSSYVLEVSSPGLERGLYKREDYRRFVGHRARLRTHEALQGQRNFRGRILGFENDEVILDDRTRGRVSIPFASIAKANLEIDLEEEFRRAEQLAAERAASERQEGEGEN
ncbi:MAG: ribosome maturation factor RimP [Pyrinomonas sp.]|uniref:ribosome maturation factor RimP n=1 Tax=Pyrinomonas sp. TaxID=2080306 RepID=UPI00332904ED